MTKTKVEHSALPWRQSSLQPFYVISGDDPEPIASLAEFSENGDVDYAFSAPFSAGNAQFIVTAVNSHTEMLEALTRAHLYFLQCNTLSEEDREMLDEMWAAIQKAESPGLQK